MSNAITGLLFGVGLSAWVYSKMMRQTGGNTKNSVIIAILAGLAGFLLIFSLLGVLFEA